MKNQQLQQHVMSSRAAPRTAVESLLPGLMAGVLLLGLALTSPPACGCAAEFPWPDWRSARLPRITLPPDSSQISVVPVDGGWAWVLGGPGAAADPRAHLVRVINLCTGDEAAAPVRADGSFGLRMFAPPGSNLQINSNMLRTDQLPWALRAAFEASGKRALENLTRESPGAEMIAGHSSSSPGTIIAVVQSTGDHRRWPGMVRKIGPALWLVATGEPSTNRVSPGDAVDLEVTLSVSSAPGADVPDLPGKSLMMWAHLHCLFDAHGRQRPYGRLPVSAVRTPTGIPIETHGEMVAETQPDGVKVWNLGATGLPLPCKIDQPAEWQVQGGRRVVRLRATIEIPAHTPLGVYGLGASFPDLGNLEFGALEPANSPALLCCLTVGDPAPPRLACLLLGSAGTGGSRGTVAREDRDHFALNMKIALCPKSW